MGSPSVSSSSSLSSSASRSSSHFHTHTSSTTSSSSRLIRSWSSSWYLLLLILVGFSGNDGRAWFGIAGVDAAPAPQFFPWPPSSTTITPVVSPTSQPIGGPGQGPNPGQGQGPVNPNACGQVSAAADAARARNPAAVPTVAAQLAFDCLQTVPNKPGPAQDLIKSLQAYVQWQSTLAWLKNPPASYMLPPTDISGGLAEIGRTAAAGGYGNEYNFQLAILQLFTSAHDGHFNYRGDAFKAFSFGNALAADIVSVSRDGREVPRLYHSRLMNDTTRMPPAITRINGQDARAAIEQSNLKFSGFQDADSQWNSVFPSYASPDAALTVAGSIAFQGPSLTLIYENGQERTQESFAIVRASANLTGIQTGEDFYNRFCNPDMNSGRGPPQGAAPAPAPAPIPNMPGAAPMPVLGPGLTPPLPGYPAPIVRDSGSNTTSGYFLQGPQYSNVAVLSVSSFAPNGDVGSVDYLSDFQRTVETFLVQCRDQGKQRLVVDLSNNGGGFVVAGFDLFAQLFPGSPRFQATNLRLAEGLVSIARGLDELPAQMQPASENERNAIMQLATSALIGNFIPGEVIRPSGQDFNGVQDILSTVNLNGDTFSAYQQSPLTQPNPDFNLTGVGSRSNPPPAVFRPEDVVLLTDGTCGSTCTLFAYFAILGLGVKTVVMGGRPQTGPMQAIAGVEGAQVFFFNDIQADAAAILTLNPPERQRELLNTELGELAKGYAIRRARDPSLAGAVNGKNSFMPTDASTPLQFLYQPANCRFYYTPQMIKSAEAAWAMAVDATWTNPALCVDGSQMQTNFSTAIDPAFGPLDPAAGNVIGGGVPPTTGAGQGTGGSTGSSGTRLEIPAAVLWAMVTALGVSFGLV